MYDAVPYAKLVENPWSEWANFRHQIALVDLALQTSFTETFNIATADAIAEGTPVVVSSAIEWVPRHYHADVDNVDDIARVSINTLHNYTSAENQHRALERYVANGISSWKDYLRV